ncbi:hypothetical protein OEZ86_011872 [Tetradesmus obliquus]|nr:hypothetical protein OEZ86_011872 [Tetradesmus obliquus]
MDLTLVSTGITFPLIFNIQQAFTRREKALTLIANLKASAVSLYFMHRDWAQDENFPASLGNDHSAAALHCKMLLMDLLRDVRKYLVAHSPYESYAEQRLTAKHNPYVNMLLADMSLSGASQLSFEAAVERYQKTDPATAALHRCYRGFSRLSVLNERLGLRSGYTKGGEGGMSRTNQYLRYMIANLEELRMIREYRTPIMMRYANGVLIHIFSMVLAPYFVHFCDSWQSLGYSRNSCPAGYNAAIVFTVICMLLYNVQQDIEQPFDMESLDDVFFDVQDEVMDDVMSPMRTAAPSGFSTPRPHGPESYCSAAMCPGSPGMRSQPDPHIHMPWAAAALAAGGGGCGASKLSQQPSLLDPVDENSSEGTGFVAVGFAGTHAMRRSDVLLILVYAAVLASYSCRMKVSMRVA